MYLTKLVLNITNPVVERGISNCEWLHRFIMEQGFGTVQAEDPRTQIKALFHLNGDTLLIQSAVKPSFQFDKKFLTQIPKTIQIDRMKEMCNEGSCVRFTVTCNPTKRTKGGKRIFLYSEQDRDEWLRRALERSGAELIMTNQSAESTIWGIKKDRDGKHHKITEKAVTFSGALRVVEKEAFWNLFCNGLGRGKAYGCGMLMLSR